MRINHYSLDQMVVIIRSFLPQNTYMGPSCCEEQNGVHMSHVNFVMLS